MILAFSHLVIILMMIIYEKPIVPIISQSTNPLNTVAISSLGHFVRNMGAWYIKIQR